MSRGFINSVQTRCIVEGEAQKSPLSSNFLGGCAFLRIACSLGIPLKNPFKFNIKSPILQTPLVHPLVFTMPLVCTLLILHPLYTHVFLNRVQQAVSGSAPPQRSPDTTIWTLFRFASQAAWYRMENGPKSKNGKKLAKKKKMAEMGKRWPKNGEKIGHFFPSFFAIFGPFFPHFGPRAIFYFLANFFPFLDFGPFSPFCTRRPDSQA